MNLVQLQSFLKHVSTRDYCIDFLFILELTIKFTIGIVNAIMIENQANRMSHEIVLIKKHDCLNSRWLSCLKKRITTIDKIKGLGD